MDPSLHQFPNTISGKGNATPPSYKQNGWTALPTVRQNGSSPASHRNGSSASPRQNGRHVNGAPHENGLQDNPAQVARQPSGPSYSPNIARRSNSNSPRVAKRQESGPTHFTSRVHHLTRIICNSLWGQKLTFHPYVSGESLIPFCSLWPDGQMLVDTFREAEFNKQPYELCKLLLATNSMKPLETLLEKQALSLDCNFGGGCGTLLHLACALGQTEVVQCLVRRSQSNTKVWSIKDGEGRIPEEVCMKAELRRLLPSHSWVFTRKPAIQIHMPKDENRRELFELAANPENFYAVINMLNTYPTLDVNRVYNDDGDLLIHVAVKGGLPQLPLLFALVNCYRADVRLKDSSGATPLALAIRAGEETLAEVLICVCGLDINQGSTEEDLTPLHVAVNCLRPKIVNMLLQRGADALKEDAGGSIPSFVARKNKASECLQIISQHLKKRTSKICEDAISGQLYVSSLYPSDLSLVSETGCTLLMLAAMHNHEAMLRDLLKKGECPLDFRQMKACDSVESLSSSLETSWCEADDDKDHSLKTAVHMAAEKGNLRCLQALLDANAHPALEDCSGWLPLHYAVDNGHIECVKSLLAYPNYLGLTGLKPALDISRGNDFTEITAVLEQAFQRRQSELIVPLLFQVAHSGNKDHLFRLLQNGDNVNPLNESSDWPLLLAAGFGFEDMVSQLHQFGGHVARRHRVSRSTPLHVAARGGHTKVVKYLLQFCRSSNSVSEGSPSRGQSVLPTGVMEDEEAQFIEINSKNAVGATPLELAASQGHTEVVKLLLERGASTTLPDSNGRLLTCSAFAGTQFLLETHRKERCRSIIDSLRSHCPLNAFRRCWQGPSDFNLYASNGDNMLMLAAQYGQPEVLKFMLEQAAEVKVTMLISSDESPLLLSSLTSSRSEDSSDSSFPRVHSRNKSDSQITPPHSLVPKPYDPDRDEPERHTALPAVFRNQRYPTPGRKAGGREERFTRSGGSGVEGRTHGKSYPSLVWRRSSAASGISSSEDEEPNGNGAQARDGDSTDEAADLSEPFIRLIRFCNVRDGQTVLHRASSACRHQNVALLMRRDDELANMQDFEGNTALHLACNKMHKPTVSTLLNFKCVYTTIRNKKNELPEHRCMKNAIKKMVCKVRQSRAGRELGLPDPPSGISVSMERASDDPTAGLLQPALPRIEEVVTPHSSLMSDQMSLKDLNQRLQQMKSEISAAPSTQENPSN